ncbi:MAG: PKD domain-containing protein, partial [Flavobacteriales bacterium]|nr:PKD domain-containing protein [Flavobacteriales bacterium]
MSKNIFLLTLLLISFTVPVFSQDSDGDGVPDALDLDDDNDGISDTDEGLCSTNNSNMTVWSANNAGNRNAGTINAPAQVASVVDLSAGAGVGLTSPTSFFLVTGATTATLAASIFANDYIQTQFTTQGGIDPFVFSNITYRRGVTGVNTNNSFNYHVGILISDDNFATYSTLTSDYFFAPGLTLGATYSINITDQLLLPATTYSVRYYFFDDNGSAAMNVDDMVYQYCTGDMDYDNDGILNHLDWDSDNDGCADAVEGGGSFNGGDLTNGVLCESAACVDSDGIPLVSNPTQSIGDSQDENTLSAACGPVCILTATDVTCNGDVDGRLYLDFVGGTPNYNIDWDGAVANVTNTSTISFNETNIAAGTYTIMVTDNLGITGTCEATIVEPTELIITLNTLVHETCPTDCDGSIDITASGGTYADVISDDVFNGNTGDAPGGTTTTYFNNSVTGIGTPLVDEATVVQVCVNFSDVTSNGVGDIRFKIINPCGGESWLKWYPDGGTGTGNVTGKDLCFIGSAPSSINGSDVSSGAGPWIPRTAFDAAGGALTGCDPNGTWQLMITNRSTANAAGLTTVDSWSLTLQNETTSTGIPSFVWDGSSITGANDNDEDISLLCDGTYTVTATDDIGCSVSLEQVINSGPIVVSAIQAISDECFTGNSFDFTNLGSTGGSETYLWNFDGGTGGSTTAENPTGVSYAAAGTYTVTLTVTDGACNDVSTASFSVSPIVTACITYTNPLCATEATGSISLTPGGGQGGYSYTWTPAPATNIEDPVNLTANTYTVTVSDLAGCTVSNTVTLTDRPPLSLIMDGIDPTCNGDADGTVVATPAGGTCPKTFVNIDGATLGLAMGTDNQSTGGPIDISTVLGLAAGSVFLEATNVSVKASGVIYTTVGFGPPVFTLTGTELVYVQVEHGAVITNVNETDGMASLDGTAFSYTGSLATGFEDVSCGGSYEIERTPASASSSNGTKFTWNSVSSLTSTQFNIFTTNTSGNSNIYVAFALDCPDNGYNYAWTSTSATVPAADDSSSSTLLAGTYDVTVTDANGCAIEDTQVLIDPTVVTVTLAETDPKCIGGTDGQIIATYSGGVPDYSVNWSSSTIQNNQSAGTNTETNLGIGTYTVTITDDSSCVAIASIDLSNPPILSVTATQTEVKCNGGNDGEADAIGTGGTGVLTYKWEDSSNNSEGTGTSATGLIADFYTVTVTDANDCEATFIVEVTEPAVALSVTIGSTDISCNSGTGSNDGTATVTFSDGTG